MLPVTQTFLPIITQDSRILGMVPIPSTVFAGSETSISINGIATPIKLVKPQVANIVGTQQPIYMAITVTPQQERSNFKSATFLASFLPYSKWNTQLGLAQNVRKETTLIQLLRGVKLSSVAAPAPTPVTANNSAPISVLWAVDMTETPENSFFEVNWVMALNVNSGNVNPASISVGAPTTDPSGGMVKAFVVQSYPAIVNDGVLMNTVRFVKITRDPIPKGLYVWPATVTNTDGSSVSVTLNVKNS